MKPLVSQQATHPIYIPQSGGQSYRYRHSTKHTQTHSGTEHKPLPRGGLIVSCCMQARRLQQTAQCIFSITLDLYSLMFHLCMVNFVRGFFAVGQFTMRKNVRLGQIRLVFFFLQRKILESINLYIL